MQQSIDKFGRLWNYGANKTQIVRGPAGVGFEKDARGNFTLNYVKLTQLSNPEEVSDATTKSYVDKLFELLKKDFEDLRKKTLPSSVVKKQQQSSNKKG